MPKRKAKIEKAKSEMGEVGEASELTKSEASEASEASKSDPRSIYWEEFILSLQEFYEGLDRFRRGQ